jgi:hypothetical protein
MSNTLEKLFLNVASPTTTYTYQTWVPPVSTPSTVTKYWGYSKSGAKVYSATIAANTSNSNTSNVNISGSWTGGITSIGFFQYYGTMGYENVQILGTEQVTTSTTTPGYYQNVTVTVGSFAGYNVIHDPAYNPVTDIIIDIITNGYPPQLYNYYNLVMATYYGGNYIAIRNYQLNPTPDTLTASANLGWNASARSMKTIFGDGVATFTPNPSTVGAVIGLNELSHSTGSDYFEISFGLHFSRGFYRVVELGVFKTTGAAFTSTDTFSIQRASNKIFYFKNTTLFYISQTQSSNELLMDVSMYSGGDVVYNSSLVDNAGIDIRTVALTATGTLTTNSVQFSKDLTASGTLSVSMWSLGNDVYASPFQLSAQGTIVSLEDKGFSDLTGVATLAATAHHVTEIYGLFGPFACTSVTGRPYGYAEIVDTFGAMTCQAGSNEVASSLTYIAGYFGQMTSSGRSLVGQTTTASTMYLPGLSALASNKVEADIISTLPGLCAFAGNFPPDIRDQGHNALCLANIGQSSNMSYYQLNSILDQIIHSSTVTTSVVFRKLITDYITVIDTILVQYINTITDIVNTSSTITNLKYQLGSLLDYINASSTILTKVTTIATIAEIINVLQGIYFGIFFNISDSINLASAITNLIHFQNTLVNAIGLSESISPSVIKMVMLSDLINESSSVSNKANFFTGLTDHFVISIPSVKGQDTYLAYLYNTETGSVTTYDNFNFTLATRFGTKHIFGSPTGLYEFGGTTDAGAAIQAQLQTIAYNFGTSNLKQIPEVYLGVKANNSIVLKVNVDDKASAYYKLSQHTQSLRTERVKLGKGLIGRYFQFELITSASNFNMESIEFYPVVLRRKI